MKLFTPLALVALTALPAMAWENTIEWRFAGTEIQSFKHTIPDFDEDPETLEVLLRSDHHGEAHIEIEADNGVDDCVELLGFAKDNPHVIMVLTANMNAQTLNGVTLAQCSMR